MIVTNGRIVGGWIAPHGVVPDTPEPHMSQVPGTNAAMKTAAERMMALEPESIVLVAPHGFRAADTNTVSLCRKNSINLGTWYAWRNDEFTAPGDSDLARHILHSATATESPAIGLIYGGTSESSYPMDWSITAPMRYLQDAGYAGALVPITFSGLPLAQEWQFGRAIVDGVLKSGKRVGFIASSDLSHVHSADGPYGVDPIAPEYDATIRRAVESNDVRSLLSLDLDWVQRAAQDGLRSILIMGGAMEGLGYTPEVLAYEVLIYFGMLTAWFGLNT
jgi:aromatic ring-opening dioxygenase LigB subunit